LSTFRQRRRADSVFIAQGGHGNGWSFYGPTGNEFSGETGCIQIDPEKDDHDHLITPNERFRLAMARQPAGGTVV